MQQPTLIEVLWKAFWPMWVLFFVLDIAVFGAFCYTLKKAIDARPKFHRKRPPKKRVLTLMQAALRERWQTVMRKFKSRSPESARMAIIEADALVDEALKRMGIKGEHMADRLGRLSSDELTTLGRIWRAHRLRNELVHGPHTALPPEVAEAAMGDYEDFLKDIGVLE